MDKVKKFLIAMRKHPRVKELIKDLKTPKNDEEVIDGYFSIAKKLKLKLTRDEIKDGLKAAAEEQKARTAEAAQKVALDSSDQEQVAGGQYLNCSSTHEDNEWCWFSDSCDLIISDYNSPVYDPKDNRDSMWDPKPGEEFYPECNNLADWEELKLDD